MLTYNELRMVRFLFEIEPVKVEIIMLFVFHMKHVECVQENDSQRVITSGEACSKAVLTFTCTYLTVLLPVFC